MKEDSHSIKLVSFSVAFTYFQIFLFFKKIFVSESFACMLVCHMYDRCPRRPGVGIGFFRMGVITGYELSCGCWELTQVLWKSK